MNSIESEIADVFTAELPGFTDLVRKFKAAGAPKSEVVRRVTVATNGKPFMRSGLLIAIDKIWSEEQE